MSAISPTDSTRRWWGLGLSLLASGGLVLQARWNGDFATLDGDPLTVAWWSFVIGAVTMGVVVAAGSGSRAGLMELRRRLGRRDGVPIHVLSGGVFGALLIMVQAASVPFIGVALFTVVLVAAQTVSSLFVDRFGLAPGGRREVTGPRIVGAGLCVAGVVAAALNHFLNRPQAWTSAVWVVAILSVSAFLPLQQAYNATVARGVDSAAVAALVNFVVGWLVVSAVVLGRFLGTGRGLGMIPSPAQMPTAWLAGLMGVAFIVVAAVVVPWLGVLVFGLAITAGQVVESLLVDAMFPSRGLPVTPGLVLGAALCVASVGVGAFVRAPARARRVP